MHAIEVDQLSRTFALSRSRAERRGTKRRAEIVHAVKDISFNVSAGECVAYLGPNGAGKSTTMKIILGVLAPTSGTTAIWGRSSQDRKSFNANRVGVVFGQRSQLWPDLTVNESLQLLRRMYAIPPVDFGRRKAELVEALGVGDVLARVSRSLSLGERVKADLIAAMLHRPDLLVLDEPTIGVDVVSKATVRELLRVENNLHGTTIILTSHETDDIEALCKRVLLIDGGRLRYDGSLLRFMREKASGRFVDLTFESETAARLALASHSLLQLKSIASDGRKYQFALAQDDVGLQAGLRLVGSMRGVVKASIGPESLESILQREFRGEAPDA